MRYFGLGASPLGLCYVYLAESSGMGQPEWFKPEDVAVVVLESILANDMDRLIEEVESPRPVQFLKPAIRSVILHS